jgi:SAM-dependent methyltransferase
MSFWEQAAQRDPLWAILSDPAKRHRGWTPTEFFETGRREISLLLHQLRTLGHAPAAGAALDFGCGVGRLTQALAPSFDRVIGIDVSPTMIQIARRLNRYPSRVEYVLNSRPDLSLLASGSLDLVYSDIVLQHIPPSESRVFVAEFLRTLRPGGIAVFQLTADRRPAEAGTARVAAMPADAYRAGPAVDGLPGTMEPGGEARIMISVSNLSPYAWTPQYGAMRIGNHWLDASGAMLIQDDGRTEIPGGVLPQGGQSRVAITVKAPPVPGNYQCEVDVVHEGVTWFADRGSRAWRKPLRVGRTSDASVESARPPHSAEVYPDISDLIGAEDTDIGDFPMYGVPRAEVQAILAAHGGRVFHVESDERGGPEWTGYRYFVVSEGT